MAGPTIEPRRHHIPLDPIGPLKKFGRHPPSSGPFNKRIHLFSWVLWDPDLCSCAEQSGNRLIQKALIEIFLCFTDPSVYRLLDLCPQYDLHPKKGLKVL